MKTDAVGGPGQKKRTDPHKWETHEALLVIPEGPLCVTTRLLRRIEVNVCAACGFWCEGKPDYVHDLPPCKFVMEEAKQ